MAVSTPTTNFLRCEVQNLPANEALFGPMRRSGVEEIAVSPPLLVARGARIALEWHVIDPGEKP